MATNVSFSGLGSGIDFGIVRDAILTQRSAPITQLQSKVSNYNGRIEALKQLNASLAALTTSAETLTNRELGTGRNGVTSDATVATASATSKAVLGNFDLNVTRIATNLTQASRNYSSSTDPFLAGGATTGTFELQKGGVSPGTTITIDSTNNSLEGLRDAINAANAGVTANVVDIKGDGTEFQLVLNSNETGDTGRVELVETSTTGTGADLNLRSLNPPDGDFTKLNAAFTLNGLSLTRPTNAVSDAVTGVNLTLKKAGTSTITITQSTDIENKLRGFVNAYNAIQDFVAGQYKKDAKDRPTGILAGDSTLRGIQQQLRSAISTVSSDNGGNFDSLSQIGITSTDSGQLEFDSTVLNDKLKTNPDDVKALLYGATEGKSGLFNSIHELTKGLSDDVTGSVQNSIKGYQNSVKSLNDSISNRLESLNRLRDSLTRQFAAADAAIGQINNQGTALTSIIKSLEPKSNN
jgi:flagellar hook-associated protein 2